MTLSIVPNSVFADDTPTPIDAYNVHFGGADNTGFDLNAAVLLPQNEAEIEKALLTAPKDKELIIQATPSQLSVAQQTQAAAIKLGFKNPIIENLPEESVQVKKIYVASQPNDIMVALVSAAWRGGFAVVGTYIILGVHSPRVAIYCLVSAALAGVFPAQQNTVDNIMDLSWKDPSKRAPKWVALLRRMANDMIQYEGLRAISGAIGAAHPVLGMAGQIEILQKFFDFSIVGNLFSVVRTASFDKKKFPADSRSINRAVSFGLFMVTAILDPFRQSGINLGVLHTFEIHHQLLNFTTVDGLTIFTYLAGMYMIRYQKDFVLKFSKGTNKILDRMSFRRQACAIELETMAPKASISLDPSQMN